MAPAEDAPAGVTYVTGAATLRSSAHRAVYSKARKADRGPMAPSGSLPEQMRHLELLDVFEAGGENDPRPAVARLLARAHVVRTYLDPVSVVVASSVVSPASVATALAASPEVAHLRAAEPSASAVIV